MNPNVVELRARKIEPSIAIPKIEEINKKEKAKSKMEYYSKKGASSIETLP